MFGKIIATWLMFWWFSTCFAVADTDVPKQAVRRISSGDMLHWGIGLLIVLAIFFFCVWGVRKLSGISSVSGAERMRVIGGLSLGMREKIVLLQIGKKQLVLGVTPGRIDALHVLEGDDCLSNESPSSAKDSGFAAIFTQLMQGRSDA